MDQPASHTGVAIRLSGISKTFGGTRALIDVSLDLRPGEIHALVGQNGCGKSTLIKILAGYHSPDPGGSLEVDGQEVRLPLSPASSAQHGFTFVHQDLGLGDSLSVIENVVVGGYKTGRLGRIRWRDQAKLVRRLLRELDADLSVEAPVSMLSQAEKATVAIARALYARGKGQARLLVLDEPTAYLPPHERDQLFAAVRTAAARGTAILFVTHRLDEVMALSDRVTVLRDGRRVVTAETRSLDEATMIRHILGRSLGDLYPGVAVPAQDDVLLSVRSLSGGAVIGVSFDLHAGEVLGITGLVGMGQDEIPYLLIGAQRQTGGQIRMGNMDISGLSPRRAVGLGIGLLPANRTADSGVQGATLRENLTAVSLRLHARMGIIHHADERRATATILEEYDVRPKGSTERFLRELSGGNQQRVLVAKWLRMPALRCMILHEPTQGIDVAAKQSVLRLINEMASRKVGVLLVSAEHEDLVRLCSRVLIFRGGRIRAELSGDQLNKDRILELSYAS